MSTKSKILFFASSPRDMDKLKLDEEIRSITMKLRTSDYRDVLELVSVWAVRPDDLLQELNTHKPIIVHFSGHGSQAGELFLMDEFGDARKVSPAALKALFSTLKGNIRLVMLNACYSKIQAEAIAEVIDCVVGMKAAIGDRAAIAFASSFYRAVGFARSVNDAFEQAKVSLMFESLPAQDMPELVARAGVDPATVYLIDQWQSDSDIIGINLGVAREMYSLRPKLEAANRERKEAVAAYYQKIAETLKEVTASLRNNIVPHGNCEKMRRYAKLLPQTVGDLIGMQKADELSNELMKAYDVESLLSKLSGIDNRDERLADLEKAAAYFEVLGDSLLASR